MNLIRCEKIKATKLCLTPSDDFFINYQAKYFLIKKNLHRFSNNILNIFKKLRIYFLNFRINLYIIMKIEKLSTVLLVDGNWQ